MELYEFIDALPFDIFSELRKVVIARHQRHSEEISSIIKYIVSQEISPDELNNNRANYEKVIVEKLNVSMEIVVKAIDRYLNIDNIMFGGK